MKDSKSWDNTQRKIGFKSRKNSSSSKMSESECVMSTRSRLETYNKREIDKVNNF